MQYAKDYFHSSLLCFILKKTPELLFPYLQFGQIRFVTVFIQLTRSINEFKGIY